MSPPPPPPPPRGSAPREKLSILVPRLASRVTLAVGADARDVIYLSIPEKTLTFSYQGNRNPKGTPPLPRVNFRGSATGAAAPPSRVKAPPFRCGAAIPLWRRLLAVPLPVVADGGGPASAGTSAGGRMPRGAGIRRGAGEEVRVAASEMVASAWA